MLSAKLVGTVELILLVVEKKKFFLFELTSFYWGHKYNDNIPEQSFPLTL